MEMGPELERHALDLRTGSFPRFLFFRMRKRRRSSVQGPEQVEVFLGGCYDLAQVRCSFEAALLCVMFEPGRPDRCRLTRPCVVRSVDEGYSTSSCTSSTKNGRDFLELVDERELNAAGPCIHTNFLVSPRRPAPSYPAEPPPSPGSIPHLKYPVRAL